jgi:hypothetical protein
MSERNERNGSVSGELIQGAERIAERIQPDCLAQIRLDLVHGYHPKRADLLALWHWIFGEAITDGVRCEACDGGGLVSPTGSVPPFPIPIAVAACERCGGSGFAVLPTSLAEAMQRDDC